MTQNTILSIIPGRLRIGYAVLREHRLLYYGGASFGQYRTKETLLTAVEKFLKRIFTKYRINHLALQQLIKQQEFSALLTEITIQIRMVAKNANVYVHEYNPMYIRQQFCRDEKSTKATTAKILVEHYVELEKYFSRTKDWERRYYGYIFAAIAVGTVCADALKI